MFSPVFVRTILLSALLLLQLPAHAQQPEWIWLPDQAARGQKEEVVCFRKTFRTPPLIWNARLFVSADDSAEVFLNGVSVGKCDQWDRPIRSEVTVRLNQGDNVIAVRAVNREGPAGLLVHLGLGGTTNLVSDSAWLASTNAEPGWADLRFNAASWPFARSVGPHGVGPWGEVMRQASATAPAALRVAPDFEVSLLRSAAPNEGSWVCMTFDEAGRLIISPEGEERPLLRFSISENGVDQVEPLSIPIHFAMGLLFAKDSLFVNARGPEGSGIYRLTDGNHDGHFETNEIRLVKKFDGASEHGYHALRLGPDNLLYCVNGNGTKVPRDLPLTSPYQHYDQDVLSVNPDETTEAGREAAAQGCIFRGGLDGQNWELWAGGFRNVYAFDFNPAGELFAFDSDMEWDWGTPWYRPTQILHGVSGGEYGWRDGTRTWPSYYEDSLPPVLEVGIGSPTGVRFGSGSNFPEKYRSALFVMDWSYGRILAVHLTPAGATYTATAETFLQGTPLNLTDLVFGPDGSMYFITGGRATQSGLYRVRYKGATAATATRPSPDNPAATEARKVREQLEHFHGRRDPAAVETIWTSLDSSDRFIRYAARVALEFQDLARWERRALDEARPTAGLTALLALARIGGPDTQTSILKSLEKFRFDSLTETQGLLKLRVMEVSFRRQGRPGPHWIESIGRELDGKYPAGSWPLNRELSRVLIYLQAPKVLSKTLDLLAAAPGQPEQFHYVSQLRNVRSGWTRTDRRRFLGWWLKKRDSAPAPELERWFADVGRSYVDGAWVDRYLREFRMDFLATLSADERKDLLDLINTPFQKARVVPSPDRTFVREWTMADLLPDVERGGVRPNLERGRRAFVDAQCISCHRFGNDGGPVGPELSGAGSKYDRHSLLESILEPSKVIAEPYRNQSIFLKDGDSFSGRIVRETSDEVILETDPLNGTREVLSRSKIDRIVPAALSPMPDGLANVLTREEIVDLVSYLQSGAQGK